MARVITGIQSTSTPHLGNILGAIVPALELGNDPANEAFFFIADLHTLTANKDPHQRQDYTLATAAAWLAFGLDIHKHIFFRQSQVPLVCELAWYLNCFTPYPMLANAHSFKDKAAHLADVNAGLFTYPVLMAADILLYDAEIVPVGQDQLQHVEITRDLARSFNHRYGEVLTLPQAKVREEVKVVPGVDGRKMSKSYHNTINIFLPDKELEKVVMSIQTDSTPLAEPKNPDTCHVFKIYSLLASIDQTQEMRRCYEAGNYGYGSAKKTLFELILNKFVEPRRRFQTYYQDPALTFSILEKGEAQAQAFAVEKLKQVRTALGYI